MTTFSHSSETTFVRGSYESLFKDDIHSLDVEELSDFLESKGIEEADTAELVTPYSVYVLYCMPLSCCVHLCVFSVHYLESVMCTN